MSPDAVLAQRFYLRVAKNVENDVVPVKGDSFLEGMDMFDMRQPKANTLHDAHRAGGKNIDLARHAGKTDKLMNKSQTHRRCRRAE